MALSQNNSRLGLLQADSASLAALSGASSRALTGPAPAPTAASDARCTAPASPAAGRRHHGRQVCRVSLAERVLARPCAACMPAPPADQLGNRAPRWPPAPALADPKGYGHEGGEAAKEKVGRAAGWGRLIVLVVLETHCALRLCLQWQAGQPLRTRRRAGQPLCTAAALQNPRPQSCSQQCLQNTSTTGCQLCTRASASTGGAQRHPAAPSAQGASGC